LCCDVYISIIFFPDFFNLFAFLFSRAFRFIVFFCLADKKGNQIPLLGEE
jgi:hypothetical protein